MNRSLLKQALIPTLLLGGLWLTFSLATTVYIMWLDAGYQRVLEENVTSIHSSGQIQGLLWNLHQSVVRACEAENENGESSNPQAHFQKLKDAFEAAKSYTTTEREHLVVQEMGILLASYDELLHALKVQGRRDSQSALQTRDRSRELSVQMSRCCDRIRDINHDLMSVDSAQRITWNRRIGGVRIVLAFMGPIFGIWLGFRAASRARRRLAEISIRLEGASGELGRLHLSPTSMDADLNDLDQQVIAITRRMDSVLEQLQTARHEVLRSERLAAVGQLAAGVAHELRNPLTSIKLLVQVVSRQTQDGNAGIQMGIVLDEISRMERTIQGLLDFARPPVQKRLHQDLRDTLARAIKLVAGRATRDRILIESHVPPDPVEIIGDPEQLHQVFVNLLLNSMDAMPNGGRACVTMEFDQSGAGLKNRPMTCVVRISDQGSGIPENVIEHLFEPFVTTKERGTGLGLAVSRRIIDEHGGKLTANNSPTGGAVFAVQLSLIA